MSNQDKKIRSDWAKFKSKQKEKNIVELKKEDISKVFSKMFV